VNSDDFIKAGKEKIGKVTVLRCFLDEWTTEQQLHHSQLTDVSSFRVEQLCTLNVPAPALNTFCYK